MDALFLSFPFFFFLLLFFYKMISTFHFDFGFERIFFFDKDFPSEILPLDLILLNLGFLLFLSFFWFGQKLNREKHEDFF